MTWMIWRRFGACAFALLAPAAALGCGLLDVSDPTVIEESDLATATGADLMRRRALAQLYDVVGLGAFYSGLLTDEFLSNARRLTHGDVTFDRRESLPMEERGITFDYARWPDARIGAGAAIERLRAYGAETTKRAYIGQMFAVQGFVTLALAENFCPGIPLNDVVDSKPVFSPPLSTEQVFERALLEFDSATVYGADSAGFLNAARVGQARALLGLGRFTEAALAAASVPTEYAWYAEYNATEVGQVNPVVFGLFGFVSQSVADREGGNGLDFVSAADPRVQLTSLGRAADSVTDLYTPAKYPDQSAPIVLASGIEARLIEAEAALRVGQPQWLTILNELRRTQVSPALPDTTDPGTEAAQVDLLFRERAFWLFATGHRLGDLRRLIRIYGRAAEGVFPTGPYRLGESYAGATSIPFPAHSESAHNPAVTGCTSR